MTEKKNIVFILLLFFFILLAPSSALAQLNKEKINLENYLNSLNKEGLKELTLDMAKYDSLEIPSNIGALTDLETLTIYQNVNFSKMMKAVETGTISDTDSPFRQKILLPQELFALPNLRELILGEGACFFLNGEVNQLSVKLGPQLIILEIRGAFDGSISFLPLFKDIEELRLNSSFYKTFPAEFYEYKNLKKLDMNIHRAIMAFDERINNFSQLEEFNFYLTTVHLPKNLSGLSKLKTASLQVCSIKEKLNEKEDYYFPLGLLSLPNLEKLEILLCGRLEFPPRQAGLKHLKSVAFFFCSIEGDRPIHVCHGCTECSREYADGTNFDNLVSYSSLEEIDVGAATTIDNTSDLEAMRSFYAGPSSDEGAVIEGGTERLIKIINSAHQKGVLPKLKSFWTCANCVESVDQSLIGADPELIYPGPVW